MRIRPGPTMTSRLDMTALDNALAHAREHLLAARGERSHWAGELSTSALSTATAATALALVDRDSHAEPIAHALDWLAGNVNADGGWGDTTISKSNLSTTLLVWSALGVAGRGEAHDVAAASAEGWVRGHVGSTNPRDIVTALAGRYGDDRTFSVPILTMCALAGRLGEGERAWRLVPALPFELGALSHRWLRRLRLPVVSYALPALIAIGQVRYHHRRPLGPVRRLLRAAARGRTLRRLEQIQPSGGGFLEAAPLTSFVVMSLAGMGLGEHPVASRGVEFLLRTVRDDGSWPIDTNLATWVTTLSVKALATAGTLERDLSEADRQATVEWLGGQQYRQRHPYTDAAPGGWAWTDLTGGVPDADDTAGAMLAMRALTRGDKAVGEGAAAAATWLMDLQNRDGGMPTFCRGWGTLEFDRSGADLTAHAAGALWAWRDDLPPDVRTRVDGAVDRMVGYLVGAQRRRGGWVPLWFGNEQAEGEANPVYGTSRVVSALADIREANVGVAGLIDAGAAWLAGVQNGDGGWGGDAAAPSTIEETAQAVGALAKIVSTETVERSAELTSGLTDAIERGAAWLVERTDGGRRFDVSPIGLYFAKLWYFERLYPVVFTVGALARARCVLAAI